MHIHNTTQEYPRMYREMLTLSEQHRDVEILENDDISYDDALTFSCGICAVNRGSLFLQAVAESTVPELGENEVFFVICIVSSPMLIIRSLELLLSS